MKGSHGFIFRIQDKNKNTALFLVPDRIESSNLRKLLEKNEDRIKSGIKCTDQFIKEGVNLSLQTVEVNKKDMNVFKEVVADLYNQLLIMGYKDTLNEIEEFFDKLRIVGGSEDGDR